VLTAKIPNTDYQQKLTRRGVVGAQMFKEKQNN